MRFLHFRLPLSVLLLALASAVSAGQKVDIYRADTLVKSQSEGERNAAARATLGEVIVRVSGQRAALNHPAIQAALPKAQNYLFGFSYRSTNEKISVDGKTFPAVGLQLNYEPQAIEQLLRSAQLPLWPAIRPKVLVWLVAKEPQGLRLVPELTDLRAMELQAQFRGLPLTFPKIDLSDSLALAADDLWVLDIEKIKNASQRYKADAILVGRYTPYSLGPIPPAVDPGALPVDDLDIDTATDALDEVDVANEMDASVAPAQGPWIGDWQLITADNMQSITDETPEVKGLFVSAVDRAADYFANQYAITPNNQGPQAIFVQVGNIGTFGEFKRAQAYMDELAMVQRLEVIKVNASGILMKLTTDGDAKLLVSTLALGRRMSPLHSPTAVNPDVDAAMLAELEQALANEQIPGVTSEQPPQASPPTQMAVSAGTADNPLLYVWQK